MAKGAFKIWTVCALLAQAGATCAELDGSDESCGVEALHLVQKGAKAQKAGSPLVAATVGEDGALKFEEAAPEVAQEAIKEAVEEAAATGATYPATLAGCLAFAALFDNTCTDLTKATSFDSVPSKTVTCTGDVKYCAGTTSGSTCTWTRKLCVTCSLVSNVPYIRIQTNSLPNRCYYAGMDTPKSFSFDFRVKFNWSPSSSLVNTAVTTVTQANTANCNIATAAATKIPSDAKFSNTGTATLDAIGVAIDGLLMNPGINSDNVDDFFPPPKYLTYTYGGKNQSWFDQCMSHTNGAYYYHYHGASPCIGDKTLSATTPARCYSVPSCWGHFTDFINNHFSKTLKPIGIAKDGHIIWGPYDSTGALFDPCKLDYCSGAVIDGVYGYATTSYHPYLPACFGPATTRGTIQQECTMMAPTCTR